MKKVILIAAMAVAMTGCSSLMLTGSITEAYEQYEDENYEKTLELITQARSVHRISPELIAELAFLKANTYRQMGMEAEATALYVYLTEQHKDSQFGYLAAQALENKARDAHRLTFL